MAEIEYTIEINPITNYTIELNEQGPQGARGYDGVGISSIDETSSQGLVDTYTITLDDGRTSNFDVTNGFSPTATVTKEGTVATITITDENGTTTAEVYDGNGSVDDVRLNEVSVVSDGVADIYVANTYDSSSTAPISGMGVADAGFITGIDSSDVTTALGYTPANDDLSNLSATGQDIIDRKADVDLSNLSSTGQDILDNKLNRQQVTNCILEAPQRVKYTLSNGTLTVLAGSVIVVPYGTTDLSSTYPVGATFLNSNFKVYETQYQDGKFFVYVEVQEDIISSVASASTAGQIRFAHIDLTNNIVYGNVKTSSGTSDVSGTYLLHYQDTKNIVQKSDGSGNIYNDRTQSLPFARIVSVSDGNSGFYAWGYVLQVFEGIGYIGLSFWVDKGVKTLTPNGLNNDGSLRNIEYTQPYFSIYNYSSISDGNKVLRYVPSLERMAYETATSTYYDASTNYNRKTSDNSITAKSAFIGSLTVDSNAITGLSIDPVLNINSMCDGQWVNSILALASSSATAPTTDIEYDLSNYLPNDNYSYEVIVNGRATTGTTSGNTVSLIVRSGAIPNQVWICQSQTRAASSVNARGSVILPIGTNRILTLEGVSGNVGTFGLYLEGYRRIGTNS